MRAELAFLSCRISFRGLYFRCVSVFVPWHHLLPRHPWELLSFTFGCRVQAEVSLRSGWRYPQVPMCSETGKYSSARLQRRGCTKTSREHAGHERQDKNQPRASR